MRSSLALMGLAALAAAVSPPLAAQTDSTLIRRALRLHHAVPMMDGHNDLPWERYSQHALGFDSADMRRSLPSFQTDIPRLRAGGVGGQFWSIWTPDSFARTMPVAFPMRQIDVVRRMEAAYPDVFTPARTADDVVRAHRNGHIASLMGIEGGDAIANSMALLRQFYDLGVRYMTLTWNRTLPWVDAAAGPAQSGGLSPFGREVVREMNRLGMLVDLSHVSDSVMVQALRISEAPVIYSHSSARALADHRRNVPDDILRMIPANGGVVLANFYCDFVDSAKIRWNDALDAQRAQLRQRFPGDTAAIRGGQAAWIRANPMPQTSITIVADHIDHIRQVAGIDHVGYGSDFDGIDCAPTGLEDVGRFPNLTAELLRRGYSDADVKKVIGLNLLRVMRQTEAVARRLQRERGPSLATLAMDSVGGR